MPTEHGREDAQELDGRAPVVTDWWASWGRWLSESSLEPQRGRCPKLSLLPLAAGGCVGLPILGTRPCKDSVPRSAPASPPPSPGKPDLGLAGSREVLVYKEGTKRHAKVAVGLAQANAGQLLWLVAAFHLACQLMQRLSKRRGQVLAQDHHHAPHQVVVQDPEHQVKQPGVQTDSHGWATRGCHPAPPHAPKPGVGPSTLQE